jgi:hypothetical protein
MPAPETRNSAWTKALAETYATPEVIRTVDNHLASLGAAHLSTIPPVTALMGVASEVKATEG